MPGPASPRPVSGFTLIELLIVVAIIAILAAIAVPNFLEAQTRSKVSRAKSDMRSVVVGLEAYRVDNNRTPPPFHMNTGSTADWWGFTPMRLTTPVSYLSSLPVMPFTDRSVLNLWRTWSGTGTANNQPYTYVYRNLFTGNPSAYPTNAAALQQPPAGGGAPAGYNGAQARDFFSAAERAGFFLYTAGPEGLDCTVWTAPMTYDPTNGTTSFGDIYTFGSGTRADSGK